MIKRFVAISYSHFGRAGQDGNQLAWRGRSATLWLSLHVVRGELGEGVGRGFFEKRQLL
jgi:hypothetical protein